MNNQNLQNLRHSCAHLLAAAVLELYPDARPAIGPAIENGFYYDFEFTTPISEDDLPNIEKAMTRILKTWDKFTHREISEKDANIFYKDNPYKKELICEIIEKGEKITFYKAGDFEDLCRGGHSQNPKQDIKAFKLLGTAGSYWRGSEKNKMLTRIYATAFHSQTELDEFISLQEEAKKRDHKKLGIELDLFYIDNQVGKGLPMWTPKGTTVKLELERFTRELEIKFGYEHVYTPYLGGEKLYETSGHLDHFKSNMYAPLDMDGDIFYLRPMACPHHIRLLQRKPLSYRDLPVRYAEIADYNRYEKSGELMGMIRVRKFQLTDGHLFVSPEGLKDEFKNVCRMIQEGMKGLGLNEIVSYRFSMRNPENKEKYFPDDELWNKAEATMKIALEELDFKYTQAKDEAAFYGPKLDVQARNVNGKEDTLFTAQIDFLLPQKFDITYIAEDGSKKRPVMIHRSTIGCLERTFAFLIEHYAGAFPLWLAPVQVVLLPIADRHNDFAQKVNKELIKNGIRAAIDLRPERLQAKIRDATLQKVPFMGIIGDKEIADKAISVRTRTGEDRGKTEITEFIRELKQNIDKKR